MAKVLVVFKKVILFPFAVLFTFLFLVAFIITYVNICVWGFLNQKIVLLCAKCALSGETALDGLSAFVAKGKVYLTNDPVISVKLVFSGKMHFEEFLPEWDNLVMKKLKPNGDLKFPELQNYITSFGGYSFYQPDKSFDLRNHIKLYTDPDPNSFIDRKKLDKIRMNFAKSLFPKKRSPWELLMVNNYQLDNKKDGEEFTVLIFKYHHALADGYATLLLFWEALGKQKLEKFHKPNDASTTPKRNISQKFMIILSAWIDFFLLIAAMPFNLIYNRDKFNDKNSWHNCKDYSETIYATLPPLNTSLVKEISRDNDVSVSAVLHSICVGAFRRMMTEKGLRTPKSIRTVFAVPLPNHPGTLTTHSSLAFFDLPTACSSEQKGLKLVDKRLHASVRSSLLVLTPLLAKPVMGTFPTANKYHYKEANFATMVMSTVPLHLQSPSDEVVVLGCRVVGTYFTIEIQVVSLPISIFILKFKSDFFISFGIQRHLLKNEDEVYEIEKYIWQELQQWKNSSVV